MRRKYVMKVVFSVIRIIVLQKKTFNTFPKEKCDSKPALNTAGKNTLMIEYFFSIFLNITSFLITFC